MKRTLLALFFAVVLLPFNALTLLAQEGDSIGQLKEQIQKLELSARNENTPAEVKEMNREFLVERRVRLRAILEKKVAALSEYLRAVRPSLPSKEIGTAAMNILNS